jgi:hypothetical protein
MDGMSTDADKRGAAETAANDVKAAGERAAEARTVILSLPQASTVTGAAVPSAVNEAAGVLADSERAIEAARVAVRQAARQLSIVHDKRLQTRRGPVAHRDPAWQAAGGRPGA